MKRCFFSLLLSTLLLNLCACGQAPAGQSSGSAALTWQEQYDLGLRYLSEGNYEEAIIAFTAAIEIDPKQAPAYVGRGDAYVLSGETEENLTAAQADYEKAIELDETNADAYLGLADVYIRQGDYDKALEILREGLEKSGENADISAKLKEIEDGSFIDTSGHTRRRNYYEADGTLAFYHLFQYDSEGHTSRLDEFNADGTQSGYTAYHRSEDGTHRYSDSYDMEGNKLSSSVWVGDENGNWLYTTEINEDGSEAPPQNVAQYDGGKQIGWDSYDENGTMTGYVRYEDGKTVYYDADGNVTMYFER